MAIPSLQMNKMREHFSGCCRNSDGTCRWGIFLLFLLLALVVIIVIVVLSLVLTKGDSTFFYRNVTSVRSNVVASDEICERLARETLALGGNSMDAVVAGAFCLSVVRPQSAGLGGGLILLHFKEDAYFLDALDEAPSDISSSTNKIGVPGFLQGLGVGHREFGGRLGFCSLILPSILLATTGFSVSKALAEDITANEARFSPQLREYLINPDTEKFYKEGETMKMEKYATLLQYICTLGDKNFYFGHIADKLLLDFQEQNITISKEDLRDYEAQVRPPGRLDISMASGLYELVYPTNVGSGGEAATLAAAILADVYKSQGSNNHADIYHATTEALKFAFAKRSLLNDTGKGRSAAQTAATLVKAAASRIVQEVHKTYNYPVNYGSRVYLPKDLERNTASITVVDVEGEVTVAMMSLTSPFGSGVLLNRTSIIMNNALIRFSEPGALDEMGSQSAPGNAPLAKRRPVSAMAPLLVLGKLPAHKEVIMTLAANNGGNQMISTTAQIVSNVFLRGFNVSDAFSIPRIHHQLSPNILYTDTRNSLSQDVRDALSSFGHVLKTERLQAEMNALCISTTDDGDNLYRIDAIKEAD